MTPHVADSLIVASELPGGATTQHVPGTLDYNMEATFCRVVLNLRYHLGFLRMVQLVEQIWRTSAKEKQP